MRNDIAKAIVEASREIELRCEMETRENYAGRGRGDGTSRPSLTLPPPSSGRNSNPSTRTTPKRTPLPWTLSSPASPASPTTPWAKNASSTEPN